MYIHEAVRLTSPERPCIKRESWVRCARGRSNGVMIQPTDSPDCCIVESDIDESAAVGGSPQRQI